MRVFVRLILIFTTVMLLSAGCVSQGNDPAIEPTNTEETKTTLEESTETILAETEDDDSVAVESLLGVDDLRLQTVSKEFHPQNTNEYLYTYRFYTKTSGELLVIENVLQYALDDFDNDGVIELFAQVFDDKQYVFCDLVDGQIVTESCELVPDSVLDYEILLDSEGYYLYEERWAWLFKDPAGYVAEVAKRSEDRLYHICPNGIIPAYIDLETIGETITTLQEMFRGEVTAYEKLIILKLLTTIELTYDQKLSTDAVDYQLLFEKWSYPYEGSTEEKNCYEQMSDLLDADPVGFLKGMATVDEAVLKKELRQVAAWLSKENFLYDADAFARVLKWMEQGAQTDREKEIAKMFREEFEKMKAPAETSSKLLKEESLYLWDAISYNPVQVLNNLSNAKAEDVKRLGQALWSAEAPSNKLLGKCYAAVDSMLKKEPTGTLKDVLYQVLLQLEWFGNYQDVYTEGQPFNYQRLFNKWTYSDGALAENCYTQMGDVFAADPESFMEALIRWSKTAPEGRNMDMIALQFAHRYQESSEYYKTLQALLENPTTAEGASAFIQQLEKIANE